ncbi:MAG: peptidoglycan-binding protein [Bradyrhizobiaceae bacterium]|nr:MAG: peptidoglycan-binding protein [Bradyrhizobiaceae bacterium]
MDEDMPRRPRARKAKSVAKAVAIDREPNIVARVLLHSPKDTVAAAVAAAAMLAIVINAVFLQAGRHPAPMFGTSFDQAALTAPAIPAAQPMPRARPADSEVKPVDVKPAEVKPADAKPAEQRMPDAKTVMAPPATKSAPQSTANAPRPPVAIPAHNDPIGDLVTSSRRISQIQRALTEYGYGQLKPTGVVGADTQAAIRQFEKDRKKPQTGQVSDWLIHEIVKLTGRPID